MGMMRRLLSISTGLAAGVMAYKLLERYNRKNRMGAELQDMDLDDFSADGYSYTDSGEEEDGEKGEVSQNTAAFDFVKENPVMRPAETLPRDKDGKIDPSHIADPADFADWDDLGCRG